MARSNASARKAGTAFETLIARAFNQLVDDRIERRTKTGAKDRGDIAGIRTHTGHRVVIECKDYGGRIHAGQWMNEAEVERINDDAQVAAVIAKRRGTTDPLEQFVVMTVADLMALLIGERP